jgi:fucose permease
MALVVLVKRLLKKMKQKQIEKLVSPLPDSIQKSATISNHFTYFIIISIIIIIIIFNNNNNNNNNNTSSSSNNSMTSV